MSAVALRGVRFAYGEGAFALDLPEWTVPVGARVGVVGPSGCGKSTLLALISGTLTPDAGTVHVGDAALHRMSERARRAWRLRHVGFVFQDFPLVDYLDVLDNVLLPFRLDATLRLDDAARARAVALLDVLGLGAYRSRAPSHLSQGERQRVAIARALVTQPSLVLADEPTTGLDAARADDVMSLLDALVRDRGSTLVMVTHDVRMQDRFDAVLTLGGGS